MAMITCPGCQEELNIPETGSGKKLQCPGCEEIFRVPGENESVDSGKKSSPKSKKPKSKKKAQSDDGNDQIIAIFASVVGTAILVLVYYFGKYGFSSGGGASAKDIEMANKRVHSQLAFKKHWEEDRIGCIIAVFKGQYEGYDKNTVFQYLKDTPPDSRRNEVVQAYLDIKNLHIADKDWEILLKWAEPGEFSNMAVKILKSDSTHNKRSLLTVLKKSNPPDDKYLPLLVDLASDNDPNNRSLQGEVANVLILYGPKCEDALLEKLDVTKIPPQIGLVRVLGEIGTKKSLSRLEAINPDNFPEANFAEAVTKIKKRLN